MGGVVERLRGIYKESGTNIAGFAARCGLRYANAWYLIKKGRKPSLITVYLICQAYHVNAQWVLFGTGPRSGLVKNLFPRREGLEF